MAPDVCHLEMQFKLKENETFKLQQKLMTVVVVLVVVVILMFDYQIDHGFYSVR